MVARRPGTIPETTLREDVMADHRRTDAGHVPDMGT